MVSITILCYLKSIHCSVLSVPAHLVIFPLHACCLWMFMCHCVTDTSYALWFTLSNCQMPFKHSIQRERSNINTELYDRKNELTGDETATLIWAYGFKHQLCTGIDKILLLQNHFVNYNGQKILVFRSQVLHRYLVIFVYVSITLNALFAEGPIHYVTLYFRVPSALVQRDTVLLRSLYSICIK
jgi:hypothetical protein